MVEHEKTIFLHELVGKNRVWQHATQQENPRAWLVFGSLPRQCGKTSFLINSLYTSHLRYNQAIWIGPNHNMNYSVKRQIGMEYHPEFIVAGEVHDFFTEHVAVPRTMIFLDEWCFFQGTVMQAIEQKFKRDKNVVEVLGLSSWCIA